MIYQQKVKIPIGLNCAPLLADIFLYCNERDFMYHLLKSIRYDPIYTPSEFKEIRNVNTVRWESRIITIQTEEIRDRKSVIAFVVNADMNVAVKNYYI